MNIERLKSKLVDQHIQLLLLDPHGKVLQSDNQLVPINSHSFNLFEEPAFLGTEGMFQALKPHENFKLECIETDFCGHTSIYDFEIQRIDKETYALLVYDLKDFYLKVVGLRKERNEAALLAKELKLAHQRLDAAYQKERENKEKLKEAQYQLMYSEKMASVGQLAAGMAHEINNPLNFIYNGLKILKGNLNPLLALHANRDSYVDTAEIENLLTVIETGALRIRDVVSDLQIFNENGLRKAQWIDIHQNINKTLDLIKNQIGEHIEVVRNYAPNAREIKCINKKINQVFLNLLLNASSFIPKDRAGKIEISTQFSDTDVRIIIKDNGIGISEDIRKNVFDPFYTTKEVGTGRGLGLSISYKIIKEHGGFLSFESEEGLGTEFLIQLPMND